VNPIDLVLAAAQTTMALAILFVLPGLTLGPLVVPGAPTPLHVIGRAIGLSLVIVAGTCSLLAGLGQLRPVPLIVALAAITVAPLAHPDVRASLRRLGSGRRRIRRWWIGGIAGLIVLGLTVVVPSRATVGSDLLPMTSTPWYYMAVARQVAETGSIPATINEWGQARPFPTDYLASTAHAAAALELLPGDLLVAFAWYRLAILVAAAILAALLLRRWFSSWVAILGACLLLSTVRLDAKFLDYRPETFGFLLALFTIWAADRAMADRSVRSAGVAMAAAVATFLSHAEVFLLLGPALVGIAVARAVVGEGRAGLHIPRIAQLRPVAVAAAILLGAVVIGSGLNAVVAGQLRLVGYVTTSRAAPPPVPPERIPAGWTFSGDPTWNFYVASVAPALDGQPPPRNFFGSSLLPRALLQVWPGLDGRGRADLLTLVGLLALPLLTWPWLDRRRRRFLLAWWLFGIGLLVGAWLLFSISSTYVPARVGPRRLMPYELLVPVMSAVLLLFCVGRLLRPGWRLMLPRRGAMVAAGAFLAILTIGAAAPAVPANASAQANGVASAPSPATSDPAATAQVETDGAGLSAIGYDALRWIDANLPADARLLTNAYTDGSMLAVARRQSILDGRAVYLEDRAFLAESTSLVLGARVLFADPNGAAAGRYLAAERVSHVLVATAGPNGNDLGGYLLFNTNVAALRGGGRYTQIGSFGDGRLLLYKVAAVP
jgi:hypothetical protein